MYLIHGQAATCSVELDGKGKRLENSRVKEVFGSGAEYSVLINNIVFIGALSSWLNSIRLKSRLCVPSVL